MRTNKQIVNTWKTNTTMVSIVCGAYNQEDYIADTLDGFLLQETDFRIEILIHDDASSDKTAQIIKSYEAQYPDIIKPVYQTENKHSQGILINYTYNLPRVTGEYIAYCDGDDYWIDPVKLQSQVDFLEKNKEFTGCTHNTKILNSDEPTKESLVVSSHTKDVFYIDDFIKGEAYFHTSSMVYRTSVMDKIYSQYLGKYRGDWFILMTFSKYGPIKYLDTIMSIYRIHDQGVWSLLNENQKIKKNLNAIIDFNKIFDYQYEENLLNLFTRISMSTVKDTEDDFIQDLFQELDTNDIIRVIPYLYSFSNRQEQTIEQQKQTIENHEQTIESQKQTIESQKQTIESQEQEIESQEQEIESQRQTIEYQGQLIDNNEKYLRSLYSSRSWKAIQVLKKLASPMRGSNE